MHTPTSHHHAAVTQLGNAALLRAVATCAGHSRQALVRLLRGLGEVEARSLHAAEGFSSLYDYCRSLSFSESEAYKRCAVARASRQFPLLLVALESGSLHLTGAAMLVKHLTRANHQALLQKAAGMSKRALEVLLLAQSAGSPAATASPRALKRAVYERDRACTYQGPGGRICGSTSRLEFHHLRAFGLGGEHSFDNITLRCACHNDYAALLDFGAVHMARARNGVRGRSV